MNKDIKAKLKALDDHFKNNPFAGADFEIDGYAVCIRHEFSKNTLAKLIYVDGVIKGEWLKKESEIGRRFMMEKIVRQKQSLIANAKIELKKQLPASLKKYYQGIVDYKAVYLVPYTTKSISAIVQHWYDKAENKSIKFIESYSILDSFTIK